MRGATGLRLESHLERQMFQFTHPVRGATVSSEIIRARSVVSIHAPRAGCDDATKSPLLAAGLFQFTHPVRGATLAKHPLEWTRAVSIHAPRAGCDLPYASITGSPMTFQFTHPVRGATIVEAPVVIPFLGFNSRTPCGVRHKADDPCAAYCFVSIHAPRAGCDSMVQSCVLWRG